MTDKICFDKQVKKPSYTFIFQDRFTTGYKEPLADLEQDCTLTASNESDGKTFLEFHRKRDTGDSNDIEIKVKLHFFKHFTIRQEDVFKKIADFQ